MEFSNLWQFICTMSIGYLDRQRWQLRLCSKWIKNSMQSGFILKAGITTLTPINFLFSTISTNFIHIRNLNWMNLDHSTIFGCSSSFLRHSKTSPSCKFSSNCSRCRLFAPKTNGSIQSIAFFTRCSLISRRLKRDTQSLVILLKNGAVFCVTRSVAHCNRRSLTCGIE